MSTSKPTGQYEIDWSHPLAKGLQRFILFDKGISYDLVNNDLGSNSGTPEYAADKLTLNGNSNDKVTFSEKPYHVEDKPSTIAFKVNIKSMTDQYGSLFSIKASPTIDNFFITSTNPAYYPMTFVPIDSSGDRFDKGVVFPAASLGTSPLGNNFWAITTNGNFTFLSDWRCYKNDSVAMSVDSATGILNQNNGTLIGSYDDSTSHTPDADFYYIAVWSDRQLTDIQIESFREDSYQFLKPVRTIQSAVYAALFGAGGVNPIAVNDAYDVTAGIQLVVSAELGILANDTYVCVASFSSAFSTAFNGA